MQPYETVDRATADDGSVFALRRRGDEWVVYVNERVLMSSRMHHSEQELAQCALLRVPDAKRVFIGGLGLGYTLRAALDRLPQEASVTVAELVPAVVEWNRGHLAALAQNPLSDARSSVVVGDALSVLTKRAGAYDVVLLDVDNGPVALSRADNQRLYTDAGVKKCLAALRPGGVLAVWSAGQNHEFERRLQVHARNVEVVTVAARKGAKGKHFIFVAAK